MAYNGNIIKALRQSFEPDDPNGKYYNPSSPFTNCALIFAYNGTGKTRLSYDFAHYGRREGAPRHTLYYNAYTEDLFTWDNDLENNSNYRLLINRNSALIRGLAGYAINLEIRKYLSVYTDIDFDIEYEDDIPSAVTFSKTLKRKNRDGEEYEITSSNIKVSRGEERLFVWCFFRCIIDQVLGGNDAYRDIEYIYIDDPMSSLDDNNVIAFAQQLYTVIRNGLSREKDANAKEEPLRRIKFVVSSHHAVFFHAMVHGLSADRKLGKYYLSRDKDNDRLTLKRMSDSTPFYYNVAMMSEIKRAIESGRLYTYHFTVLRSIMEKIREFFGHNDFSYILEGITYRGVEPTGDELSEYYSRVVNVLTHQGAMFTPTLMNDDNRELVASIFYHLLNKYHFVLPDLTDSRSEARIRRENEQE